MIIKIKPKRVKKQFKPHDIRYRKKFFIYKRYKDMIFLFQTMYIKEKVYARWPRLYDVDIKLKQDGFPYDASNISFTKWWRMGINNLYWVQLDIVTKAEAFAECL